MAVGLKLPENRIRDPAVQTGMTRSITGVMALALVVLLAACSGDGDDSTGTTGTAGAGGEEATITIDDFAFSGSDTVAVGESVTVTNEDSVAHTWTGVDAEFDSGSLAQGASFEFTFEEAGEFDYFCAIHPTMTGSITVEG